MSTSPSAYLTEPPPPGIECECEVECSCPWDDVLTGKCDHEPSHWHQRYMGASCDGCRVATIEGDFHVFTRAQAYEAIAHYAVGRGWSVSSGGKYLCPACHPAAAGMSDLSGTL